MDQSSVDRLIAAGSDAGPLGGMVQELLGCQWGRGVATPDDKLACSERAVQIVVLHDGPRELAVKLCEGHRDRILQETTPREVAR